MGNFQSHCLVSRPRKYYLQRSHGDSMILRNIGQLLPDYSAPSILRVCLHIISIFAEGFRAVRNISMRPDPLTTLNNRNTVY